jgi:hypothetical protein
MQLRATVVIPKAASPNGAGLETFGTALGITAGISVVAISHFSLSIYRQLARA